MSVFHVITQRWMHGTAVPTGRTLVVTGQPLEISVFHVFQGAGSMELLFQQVEFFCKKADTVNFSILCYPGLWMYGTVNV